MLLKVGSNLRIFFGKVAVSKKKRHSYIFFVSRLHIESVWAQWVCFEADSMAEPETKNCSRVIFCNAALIIRTDSKFQTPLTLSSHNPGLKNYSINGHHIFRTGRTCIRVIGWKAKKKRILEHFPTFGQFWSYRTCMETLISPILTISTRGFHL